MVEGWSILFYYQGEVVVYYLGKQLLLGEQLFTRGSSLLPGEHLFITKGGGGRCLLQGAAVVYYCESSCLFMWEQLFITGVAIITRGSNCLLLGKQLFINQGVFYQGEQLFITRK